MGEPGSTSIDPETPPGGEVRRPSPLRPAITGIAVVAVIGGLYFARPALAPVLFAIVIALLLSPLVESLARWRVPRALAAALVVLSLLGFAGALLKYTWTPAREWIDRAPQTMRTIERKLRPLAGFVAKVESVTEQADRITEAGAAGKDRPAPVATSESKGLVASTQEWVVALVSVLVLCYFLLAGGPALIARASAWLPGRTGSRRALLVTEAVRRQLADYFAAVTLSNAVLGTATTVVMYVLDMPNPLLWGVVAFALNYVPYAGSAITFVLLAAVALVSFEGITAALLVAGAYLVLSTLEGQVVQPMLVGSRLDLEPVVIFLGLWFGGWLWGVAGVVLAVPVLVAVKAIAVEMERTRGGQQSP